MCSADGRDLRAVQPRILIFGGTTEGRMLAEFCAEQKIPAWICVVSRYGWDLVPESPFVKVRTGAMETEEMVHFIKENQIGLVVDATHPYARNATANIQSACEETGIERLRCAREQAEGGQGKPDILWVRTPQEAAAYLETRPGRVLVTTGSKELSAFTALTGFAERVYARILPSVPALSACEEIGLKGRHLICMQGPFSAAMNEALIRELQAEFLVTKEAGKAGGFEEKLLAAKRCGITCIVIGRPVESEGIPCHEICRRLERFWLGQESGMAEERLNCGERLVPRSPVILAGIGTGAPGQMTAEVLQAIRESEVLLGAPRVLKSAAAVLEGRQTVQIPSYLAPDVLRHLEAYRFERAAVLFSGDTGFYSGAQALVLALREKEIPYRVLPGISSVSYFAAKLGVGWEDALLATAHGRTFDPAKAFRAGARRIFLLLGGENGAGLMCRTLCEEGLGEVRVAVGEQLSYPEERICRGTAKELQDRRFEALCVMFMERKEEGR